VGFTLLDTAAAAALGYVVGFGPLDMGSSPSTLVLAAMLGAVALTVRLWQKRLEAKGDRRRARTVGRVRALVAVVIVAGIGALTATQLALTGYWALPGTSRAAVFTRLCAAIKANYPYFEYKGISWRDIQSRFAEDAVKASSDDAYYAAIEAMLAELRDGHTDLMMPYPGQTLRWLGSVRPLDGQAVVTYVRASVNIPGLKPGAVIVRRDGLPVESCVYQVPPGLRTGSTTRQSELRAYSTLLAIPGDSQTTIEYLDPDGEFKTAVLTWTDDYLARNTSAGAVSSVSSKTLPSGVGLIRVSTLDGGRKTTAEFDRAVDKLMNAPGIIVDIRGNGGGDSRLGDAMAGRFMDTAFVYGCEYYRTRIPQHAWASRLTYKVKPRGRFYSGPVAVLVDTATTSSAEMMAVAMQDSGRAILVGRPTAGSSGNPIVFNLPGGKVRFSTGDFRRNTGSPIEGLGVTPDIEVRLTAADIATGRDPDVAAAEAALITQP
jgi:C-terminal processing protease CtpA/Prc